MSYTVTNFKTKKALKEAVKKWHKEMFDNNIQGAAKPVRCFQPGLGPDLSNYTGSVALEGPHYPVAHTWYVEGEMKDGILVKVK